MIHVDADYPASVGSTSENLEAAAAGEHEEFTELYKEAAEVAAEEGFDDIAKSFTEIAEVEERHYERYAALFKLVSTNSYFKREHKVYWKCRNCGYVHEGEEAPQTCQLVSIARKYFENRLFGTIVLKLMQNPDIIHVGFFFFRRSVVTAVNVTLWFELGRFPFFSAEVCLRKEASALRQLPRIVSGPT